VRILLLTPFYAPDLGPSASLYEMLSEELVRLGHEVSVISAVPHYPSGRVPDGFRGRWARREQRNGVDVTRVWVPSVDRSRLALRLLGFLCYQVLAACAALHRRCDVVIASSPAFEIALPLFVLAFLRRLPLLYSVHEMYPEVGVALGIFRWRALIRLVDWLERRCCRRAALVRVLSEGYRKMLRAKGLPSEKLAVIWDWVDPDFIRPLPRRNSFSMRWGIEDAFVVMYAGNLGPTQGLETVLEAAELLAGETSIRFVLVGDGASRADLEKRANAKGLTNVLFAPFQPRALLPEVLASANVSLLTLKKGLGADSVPSKLYSILASSRPVVAAVDEGTDIAKLVNEAGCGLRIPPEDPEALRDAVLELRRDPEKCKWMSENGRDYVMVCGSKQWAAERFDELLRLAAPPQKPPVREDVPEHARGT
jgi:colanic acid biosynthesis glycosyl transferase WcaI